jgi:serine protease
MTLSRTSIRLGRRVAVVLAAIAAVFTASPYARQATVKQPKVPTVTVPTVSVKNFGQQPAPPKPMPGMSAADVRTLTTALEQRLDYLPGEVLVRFKPNAGRAGQQRALSALPSHPDISGAEWIGDVALIRDASEPDGNVLAGRLRAEPDVLYAEPNHLRYPLLTPNDPSFSSQQWNFQSIGMQRAWDISPGGSSDVIVAVIDTGVTSIPAQTVPVMTWDGSAIVPYALPVAPSPDFSLSRFVLPRDFSVSTTAPPAVTLDYDGHGTHVAGTIGENTNNGLALAGIAYNARIMPLKVCSSFWDVQFARSAAGIPGKAPLTSGTCSDAAIVAAIRFAADNGAKVINISLGGGSSSQPTLEALNYAVSKGVFVAIANGNSFEDGNDPSYPAVYAAHINGVMSVAATNRAEKHAYYSTTGSNTEIAAPGGDAHEGNFIWQASISQSDAVSSVTFPRIDRYFQEGFSGTSMASPHVAGIAALIMSRSGTNAAFANPATVESILRQSAKDIGAAGKDDEFGYGLVQPFAALFGLGIRGR